LKILVTGGAGFIGSNFVRNLLAGDLGDVSDIQKLTVLDSLDYSGNMSNLLSVSSDSRFQFFHGDIQDAKILASVVPGHEIVIHFAAKSHVDRSIDDPHPFFATNVLGTQTLLQASLEGQVKTFIHVSTDEVYGTITEGSWTESSPLLPNSPYAASKGASDLVARSYWRTYGLDIRITRCTNNYGPNQYPEKFIPLLLTNLIEGKKIPIYGDGLNVRDWLHVDDHCRGIWMVATKGRPGEIYNIGGGAEIANVDLAKKILTLMGSDASQIEYTPDRKGHDFRYSLDYSKVREEIGYLPLISFETGLQSTIDWYKKNKEWWSPLKLA
jgi:dTDP-glucose 4,6-dehydratase